MKNLLCIQLLLAALLLHATGCVVGFESARMTPKGHLELKGSYAHVRFNDAGESAQVNDAFGIGVGYGLSDRVNVKLRYDYLSHYLFETSNGLNHLTFGPKVALLPGRIAALLPLGLYFDSEDTSWGLHPAFLFNLNRPNKIFEIALGLRGDFFFEEDADVFLGANLGFGFSQNLDRWAIRPDFGLIVNPGESGVTYTFGLGVQYNVGLVK